MSSKSKFYVTHHARHRYLCRFANPKKYFHFSFCTGCDECKKGTLLNKNFYAEANSSELLAQFNNDLEMAKENCSFLNDTNLTCYLYEKYGFDRRFHFYVKDDIIFVCVEDGPKLVVTTCMTIYCGSLHRLGNRLKFKRKEKCLSN